MDAKFSFRELNLLRYRNRISTLALAMKVARVLREGRGDPRCLHRRPEFPPSRLGLPALFTASGGPAGPSKWDPARRLAPSPRNEATRLGSACSLRPPFRRPLASPSAPRPTSLARRIAANVPRGPDRIQTSKDSKPPPVLKPRQTRLRYGPRGTSDPGSRRGREQGPPLVWRPASSRLAPRRRVRTEARQRRPPRSRRLA